MDYQYKIFVDRWLRGEVSGIKGKTQTSGHVRRYIIQTRGKKCECCGNTHWLGKPIPLDLDHIDGNWENNCQDNLRLLCLNCHGLTETYKAKNKGGRPRAKYYRGL